MARIDGPKTYGDCVDILQHKESKQIGHNTWLVISGRGNGAPIFSVVFHKTAIATFLPDGRIILDSGGYWTTTTKDRLNQLGFNIYSQGADEPWAVSRYCERSERGDSCSWFYGPLVWNPNHPDGGFHSYKHQRFTEQKRISQAWMKR